MGRPWAAAWRARPPGGMGVHRRLPPGLGDESADVFDLALDRVGRGVPAVAPAVVVEHGDILRQLLGGRAHQGPVAHRSAHQVDRRTIAQSVEGDGGAVARSYRVHGALLPIRARNLDACVSRVPRARPLPPSANRDLLRPSGCDRLAKPYGNSPKIQLVFFEKQLNERPSGLLMVKASAWLPCALHLPKNTPA